MKVGQSHLKHFPQNESDQKIFIDVVLWAEVGERKKQFNCKAQWDTGADVTHITNRALEDFKIDSIGGGKTKGMESKSTPVNLFDVDISIMEVLMKRNLTIKQMP